MSELRDLYQEVILDHYKKPRNQHAIADASHSAKGYNPLCGDRINVQLKLEDDVLTELSFEGAGCAISTASASLMTEALKGKSRKELDALFKKFHELMTGDDEKAKDTEGLGKLAVLSGVREFPVRIKCATLAWHTLRSALQNKNDPRQLTSTEEGNKP